VNERAGGADGALSSLGAFKGWGRIEPLIDAVLDTPPDRRDEVARELSGGDDAVYARLQSLAADCAKNHRLLDQSAAERFASLFDPDRVSIPETHLTDRLSAAVADRYRTERELGSGGMATVYLAQDSGAGRTLERRARRAGGLRPERPLRPGRSPTVPAPALQSVSRAVAPFRFEFP
jgi:hypothetical protein